MKKLIILLTLTMSISSAIACPSQIIIMPDGTQMVCFYCNGGKIVNCEKL